ncbi:hypothetical protein EIP91_011459 [Steccherinum ochraceum]|uniref:RING-type domain-containing protein n=1 Tax=Steccherinum ochraceum TaxID=92696 RepID=A0A4R0RIH4_9APHY|nr:hypothetical protein EIP91_011459 [Steccherinum ochraceum]
MWCLTEYIQDKVKANASPTAIPCPSCKVGFSIVKIMEQSVGPQIRQYLISPIRKVYIPDDNDLKEECQRVKDELHTSQIALEEAQGQIKTHQNRVEELSDMLRMEKASREVENEAHRGRTDALSQLQVAMAQQQTSNAEKDAEIQVLKASLEELRQASQVRENTQSRSLQSFPQPPPQPDPDPPFQSQFGPPNQLPVGTFAFGSGQQMPEYKFVVGKEVARGPKSRARGTSRYFRAVG